MGFIHILGGGGGTRPATKRLLKQFNFVMFNDIVILLNLYHSQSRHRVSVGSIVLKSELSIRPNYVGGKSSPRSVGKVSTAINSTLLRAPGPGLGTRLVSPPIDDYVILSSVHHGCLLLLGDQKAARSEH